MAKKQTSNTSGTTTTDGSTLTNTAGYVTYDFNDYSKELAVLKSDMDDLTKIKIIQALAKPNYSQIYWGDPVYKPISTQPEWTCNYNTGNAPINPVSVSSYTLNQKTI